MTTYHVNPATGNPSVCKALKACPFGGSEVHADSKEEASKKYEEQVMSSGEFSTFPSNNAEKKARLDLLLAVDSYNLLKDSLANANKTPEKYTILAGAQEKILSAQIDLSKTLKSKEDVESLRIQIATTELAIANFQLKSMEADEPMNRLFRGGMKAAEDKKRLALEKLSQLNNAPSIIDSPAAVTDYFESKYPGLQMDFRFSHGDYVALNGIRLPKEGQGQGVGTEIMNELISIADENNWKMALTPSTDWGASSKSRLERFYRRFGFVPNKGRNKDFTTMEAMIRPASQNK